MSDPRVKLEGGSGTQSGREVARPRKNLLDALTTALVKLAFLADEGDRGAHTQESR
jgi:hypothetical protein